MTLKIAPEATSTSAAPSVGIFWLVDGVLIVDCSILADAEAYGDCITHAAGHYERWQEWQKLDGTHLTAQGYPGVIVASEYDEWPRGRIVYETLTRRFVLYADRRLQKREIVDALKNAFSLSQAEVIIRSDAHYR